MLKIDQIWPIPFRCQLKSDQTWLTYLQKMEVLAEGWGRFIDLLASIRMTLEHITVRYGLISKPHIWDNYQLWSRLSTPALCLHSIVAIAIGKLLLLLLLLLLYYNNKRKLNLSTRYIWWRNMDIWWKTLCTLRMKKGTIFFPLTISSIRILKL